MLLPTPFKFVDAFINAGKNMIVCTVYRIKIGGIARKLWPFPSSVLWKREKGNGREQKKKGGWGAEEKPR